MTQSPTKTRGGWRSKWRWVVAYWVVQAVAMHALWSVFMWDSVPTTLGELLNRLTHSEVLKFSAVIVGMVTLMQAVLLMPVHRPGLAVSSFRVRLLHCGLSATTIAGALWLLIWPVTQVLREMGLGDLPDFDSAVSLSLPIAAWIVSFAFLWPREDNGVPVLLSVLIAALGAALLVTAILGAVSSIADLVASRELEVGPYLMLGGGCLAWIVFTPLLLAFCRRQRPESALAKVASRLFLGTMIEAAAIIPLDVMVRKRFSCYCGQGTFWALSFCWGVGALVMGPAVFLLPLSGRRKRRYGGLCDVCDYDMNACMDADRCPECGAGWKANDAIGNTPVTS